jgi:hypothetical protein
MTRAVLGKLGLIMANRAAEVAEQKWRERKADRAACSTAQRQRRPGDMCDRRLRAGPERSDALYRPGSTGRG